MNFNRIINISIILVCLVQLGGCSFLGRRHTADGAPAFDIDPSRIHDAVPRQEALSKYGNGDYWIGNRHYRVLRNAKGYSQTGYASWYGTKFHGRLTSTHERYDLYAMTAASPVLPLPTYVQVTNLRNGKKVVVKVNDRGPFRCHRILDLSYAAAKKLGFSGAGTTKVKVVAIDTTRHWRNDEEREASPSRGIYLQVGAFKNLAMAQNLSQRINHIVNAPTHVNADELHSRPSKLYRVQVGPILSRTESYKVKQLLESKGIRHAMVVDV